MTVCRVLELIATYPDRAELFREFPDLTDEDLAQVLAYAAAQLPGKPSNAHGRFPTLSGTAGF